MFLFDPLENIRGIFSGGSEGNIGKEMLTQQDQLNDFH